MWTKVLSSNTKLTSTGLYYRTVVTRSTGYSENIAGMCRYLIGMGLLDSVVESDGRWTD